MIIFEKAGLLTTVQDLGRTGYQRFGMPVSGVMDAFAMRLANILVGNKQTEAVLEITRWGRPSTLKDRGHLPSAAATFRPGWTECPLRITEHGLHPPAHCWNYPLPGREQELTLPLPEDWISRWSWVVVLLVSKRLLED